MLTRIKFDRISAARMRDSVIKHIYAELFRVIIERCNTGNDLRTSEFVAILDIAGFGKST